MDFQKVIGGHFHPKQLGQSNLFQLSVGRNGLGELINLLNFQVGAEIGVYRADFTCILAQKSPETIIYAIDAWQVYPEYKNDDYHKKDLEINAYKSAISKTAAYPNIKIVKKFSKEASKDFKNESLDFVYIDANHEYQHVLDDLELWTPKVKNGGLICGHDYVTNHQKKVGVIEALNTWMTRNGTQPIYLWPDRTPSWMYIKT